MKNMMKYLSLSLVAGSLLAGCGQERYLYASTQAKRKDQSFRVRSIAGASSVDMVWVIDNSGSMDSYQQQVIQNANVFMSNFITQGVNWKLGLVSTDEDDKPYVGFQGSPQLDATVLDPVGVFSKAVSKLGTSGSAVEKTYTPILKALNNDPSFLRPNTPSVFIMVTDAQEQSSTSTQDFLNALNVHLGGRNAYAYGVFAARDLNCNSDEGNWDYKNSPYEQFITSMLAGRAFPICQSFGTSLSDIGYEIVTRITRSAIYLTSKPLISSIRVLYQDEELPPGTTEKGGFWTYDTRLNAIIFNNLEFSKNDTDSVRILFDEDDGIEHGFQFFSRSE